jgi:adenosylcobinamide-GDP ribazoletransferase
MFPRTPGDLLHDVIATIVFFTRLPAPRSENEARRFADSLWAAPVAGLAVGLVGGVTYLVVARFGIPPLPAAALALTAVLIVTGCLHEDGLSDTADGFGGGKSRERKLEIMHDSRIGAFGASALAASMLIRWSALASIILPWPTFLALIAAHVASRAAIPAFMHIVPPARNEGLSATVGAVSMEAAALAAAIGFAGLLPLGISTAIAAAVALVAWLVFFRWLALRQIGGQTGDVIGAMQQGAEIIVLAIAAASFANP